MKEKQEQFEPLQAIGLFWIMFGILILIAIFFTETGIGKLTNSICGGILLLVGLFCYFRGRANKIRRLKSPEETE